MTACSRQRRCNTATLSVSPNTVRRGLQLRPYGSDRYHFLTIFFLGHGHYSHKFSDRYLEKKFWEKISPRGVRPPKFLNRFQMPPRAMRLQNFIAISQKLWPLASGNYPVQTEKKKQGCRCPAQTGSPTALIHVPLDRAGGT